MTVQIYDSLNLEGTHTSIACDMGIAEHRRIRKLNVEEAGASYPGVFSTPCRRNFLASWAIKDGRLYLIDIIGIYSLIGEELLYADWYSGTLCIPAGEMIRRPHIGYSGIYERELYIEVMGGIVIRQSEKRHDLKECFADPGQDAPSFLRRRTCGL